MIYKIPYQIQLKQFQILQIQIQKNEFLKSKAITKIRVKLKKILSPNFDILKKNKKQIIVTESMMNNSIKFIFYKF